nr:MAG: replication associated protein [Arizlama virus]
MRLNVINNTEVNSVVGSNTSIPTTDNNNNNNNNNKRSRGWMITINNPTNEDEHSIRSCQADYFIYQFERGESGTLHIQLFIYYKNPRVWPKRWFPTAHIEPARDVSKCIEYCSKSESRVEGRGPYEQGDRPEQGRRRDLEHAALSYLLVGEREFVGQQPGTFIRYFRGLRELKSALGEDRKTPPIVAWLYGDAGTGKTSSAYEIAPDSCYIKDGTQWWNNYNCEKLIIIDDFDGRWPYRDLLRLLDRYPYQGQTKGGYVKINSPYIVITCEHPPDHFWNGNELAQVTRRITFIECIGKYTGSNVSEGFTIGNRPII